MSDENLEKLVDISSVRPFLLGLSNYHPPASSLLFNQQFIYPADGAHSYMAKHLVGLQKMLSAFPSFQGSVTPTEVTSTTPSLGLYGIIDSSLKPDSEFKDSYETNHLYSKTPEN